MRITSAPLRLAPGHGGIPLLWDDLGHRYVDPLYQLGVVLHLQVDRVLPPELVSGGRELVSGGKSWSVGAQSWSVGNQSWSVGAQSWSVGEELVSGGPRAGQWGKELVSGGKSWSVGERAGQWGKMLPTVTISNFLFTFATISIVKESEEK
jgi:hypothetical protein